MTVIFPLLYRNTSLSSTKAWKTPWGSKVDLLVGFSVRMRLSTHALKFARMVGSMSGKGQKYKDYYPPRKGGNVT